MMFCELFVPRGAHGAEELRAVARRLTMKELLPHIDAIPEVAGAEEAATANPGVVDFLDSITHVVVHEIDTWIVDSRPLTADAPRYVVRVYVPGPWRKAMSAFLIGAITHALATTDPDPRRAPEVEVHVLGVPEGSYGAYGRVVEESGLMEMISGAKTDVPAEPGALIDPVCGMDATNSGVPVLEHEGITYGFCSPGCRKHFAATLAGQAAR